MTWLMMVLCAGLIWVLVFDALGSLLARRFGFRYMKLSLVQLISYALAGAVAGLHASPVGAAVVGGTMGLAESTAGWAISWYIGPGRVAGLSLLRATRVVATVTVTAATLAFAGALLIGARWP